MRFTKTHTILILIGAILFSQITWAHGPRFKQIATTAVIAKDANSAWSASDVASGVYDQYFEQVTEPIPNLDFTNATYWMKFPLSNDSNIVEEYYLETGRSLTNELNLYSIENGRAILLYKTGDELPFTERPVIYRKFVFPVTIYPGETFTLLFQARSDGEVLTMPIKLWEKDNFNGFVQRENLTLGIYFGLLIFVFGLFGFFSIIIKERIYFYYVSYIAFLFFMQASLDSLAFEYIWPQLPWVANHSIIFFSAASVFMLMMYASEFLTIREMTPWFRNLYFGMAALVLVCSLTGLTSGIIYEITYPIINGLSLLSLLMIIAAIYWKRRTENVNIFFSLGFLTVLAGGIVFILTNFNVIYSDFLSQNAIKLGSAGEVTFLSLAMVGRYREIQKEKEAAQKEAFKNLEKLAELTQEQNVRLDRLVVERTTELRDKNEELAEKNKEIIDSINYAKRIQTAILPPEKMVNKHLENNFVLYKPKDIVAGDFYWVEPATTASGESIVLFASADCTGHGVPGAMVSVVCVNSLNRSVREFALIEPGKILDQTRELVIKEFEKSEEDVKDGMDISICALNPITRELKWAGANNPLWIIPKAIAELSKPSLDDIIEIKPDKQPIGKFADPQPFTTYTLKLNEGDTIYIFTDGYADQFGGPKGKKFKYKAFKELLLEVSQKPMNEQRTIIDDRFEAWRGDLEQIDDVCIIAVKV